MNVSPGLARKIVESMKQIINQDINFIDQNGIIIASTDAHRVGTFHEAGKKVIESNQMIIINSEEEYKGARPGINMPVNFNNTVIAAIGITGDARQVTTYGNIIRKMTEILILEEEFQSVKQRERERERMLLEDLIFYPEHFLERWNEGTLQNWRNGGTKRVLIIKTISQAFNFLKEAKTKIEQFFPSVLHSPKQSILFMEREQMLVLLFKEDILPEIRKCVNILLSVSERTQTPVLVAYGSSVETDFKQSYTDALLALDTVSINTQNPVSRIIDYNELTIELLLTRHNKDRQHVFCERVLGPLTPKEKDEFHEIITCFEKHNGSITHVSQDLFIHKNTLQYKIQKLKRLTGYDLRNYRDFMILRLAFTVLK